MNRRAADTGLNALIVGSILAPEQFDKIMNSAPIEPLTGALADTYRVSAPALVLLASLFVKFGAWLKNRPQDKQGPRVVKSSMFYLLMGAALLSLVPALRPYALLAVALLSVALTLSQTDRESRLQTLSSTSTGVLAVYFIWLVLAQLEAADYLGAFFFGVAAAILTFTTVALLLGKQRLAIVSSASTFALVSILALTSLAMLVNSDSPLPNRWLLVAALILTSLGLGVCAAGLLFGHMRWTGRGLAATGIGALLLVAWALPTGGLIPAQSSQLTGSGYLAGLAFVCVGATAFGIGSLIDNSLIRDFGFGIACLAALISGILLILNGEAIAGTSVTLFAALGLIALSIQLSSSSAFSRLVTRLRDSF